MGTQVRRKYTEKDPRVCPPLTKGVWMIPLGGEECQILSETMTSGSPQPPDIVFAQSSLEPFNR